MCDSVREYEYWGWSLVSRWPAGRDVPQLVADALTCEDPREQSDVRRYQSICVRHLPVWRHSGTNLLLRIIIMSRVIYGVALLAI